jgi:hypothetical protein
MLLEASYSPAVTQLTNMSALFAQFVLLVVLQASADAFGASVTMHSHVRRS